MSSDLRRRIVGEFVATAGFLAAIVGSGIVGERLANGNLALALLLSSLATGAALLFLITVFRPISGAHLNPVLTLVEAWEGGLAWRQVPIVLVAQFAGAGVGVWAANVLGGGPWISVSTHDRSGFGPAFGEFVAAFGLVGIVLGCSRRRNDALPYAVSAYIVAAHWFTPSRALANPVATIARTMTGTFAGIRSANVDGFVIAQLAGGMAAAWLFRWILSSERPDLE